MRRLILAAALAAASASFAFAPVAFADNTPYLTFGTGPDAAGVDDLGVDISGVTLSPMAVHNFLTSQAPEVRRQIENACGVYTAHPSGAGEKTLAFCADIGKA
jgi:hypothetical protein